MTSTGRRTVYPSGTATINVPLRISAEEAQELMRLSTTRTDGARTLIKRHMQAVAAARGTREPANRAELHEALAATQRLLEQARAIGKDDVAQELTARYAALYSQMHQRGGLAVAADTASE